MKPSNDIPAGSHGMPCPLCGGDRVKVRYVISNSRIVFCPDCTLMRLAEQPTQDELLAVYNDEYFTNKQFFAGGLYGYVDYISERINKQKEYADLFASVNKVLREQAGPGGETALSGQDDGKRTWLDVGCGLGYLLDAAVDHGFCSEGIEFNQWAVGECRKRYAFPVHCGSVEDVVPQLGQKKYDVVSLLDVIEHVPDPFLTLQIVRGLLKPGGVLVIVTQDSLSWTSRLIGSRLEDFRRVREHLFFFSRDSLERSLSKAGMTTVVERYCGHTFEVNLVLRRVLYQRHRKLYDFMAQAIDFVGLGGLKVPLNPQV